jgi:thiamine biosynthesis lipoprotein
MPSAVSRRNFLSFDFGRRASAGDHWVKIHRLAMACRVEITLSSEDAGDVPAAREALDEADRLEAALTVFHDTSEVARVNARAADEPVAIGRELFGLLQLSRELHVRTEGAFDVTAAPLTRRWGFLGRQGCVPDSSELAEARACVGMEGVTLDAINRSVRFDRKGMELNFGGIGKGYVLDRMGRLARRRGMRHALLSAGASSIVAIGGRGDGWAIDLRPLRAERRVARLSLRDGAVGTSGAGEQFFEAGGLRYGHVLDPRTGAPASGVLGASVIAQSGAVADALSTAFLVGGPDLAERYCAAYPQTLAVLVLDNDSQPPFVCGHYAGAALEMCS